MGSGMKILIVNNFYPPHYIGGYELRCSQVAEYLHRVGYEVRILTSSYRLPTDGNAATPSRNETIDGVPVERSLHYRPLDPPPRRLYTLAVAKRQLQDVRRFIQILDEFQPDIVNWWNIEGLTKAILPIPAARHIPDVCWVEDSSLFLEYGLCGENEHTFWFPFWQGNWGPSFLRPLLRWALAPWERRIQREGIPTRPFANRPRHVCFVSEFLRFDYAQGGLVFPSSEVIYGGVFPEEFYAQRTISDFLNRPLRFLYAGYINPDRGLHTIIEALGLLPLDLRERVQLSIAHSGPPKPAKYIEEIKSRIEQLGLSSTVRFLGRVQHQDMPEVFRDHHALIFASTRKEGLPLTMMEAMCAGCAVITTGSGGAIELADVADLPIFPKEHPVALSRLLAKLVRDPERVFQIGKRGQEVVLNRFTFGRMIEGFCNTLRILCEREGRQPKPDARPAVEDSPEEYAGSASG